MTSQSAVQDRVNTLETYIAHQEKLIEELSEVTAKQWQEISALSNQLERLSDKLKAIEGGMEVKSQRLIFERRCESAHRPCFCTCCG